MQHVRGKTGANSARAQGTLRGVVCARAQGTVGSIVCSRAYFANLTAGAPFFTG